MRNPFLFIFGLIVMLLGFAFLFDQAFGFDLVRFVWPIGLILAGLAVILLRNKTPDFDVEIGKQNNAFISEMNRNGRWLVENESFSAFIADMTLDLSNADIPKGETIFALSGFIGDISVRVPDDVGVMVSSSAFISELSAPGMKEGGVLGPSKVVSDEYDTAVRKIRIEASYFISDITVQTTGYPAIESIKEKSPSMLA